MNKLVFTIIILLNISIFSQGQWTLQSNPRGFGYEAMLGKVQFVSATEGWIACNDGGFLHTTNSGTNWVEIKPFINDTLSCYSDPAFSMSWIGSNFGANINTVGSFNGEPNGAVVIKTTNGGTTWEKIQISNEPGVIGVELQFVNESTGWILIFNTITKVPTFLRTTDGGNNWSPLAVRGIFYFVDENNGWAFSGSGDGTQLPQIIYRTTNGGVDWVDQFIDSTDGIYNCMRFFDLSNGWIVGKNGKVLKTTDGGNNWITVTNSGVNPFESSKTLFMLDANHIWLPSKTPGQQIPYIQYTSDGGSTWATQMTPLINNDGSTGGNAIFSIYFTDLNNGWVTADLGRIAKFTNITSVAEENNSVNSFQLYQNYPNPFNPGTTITFRLEKREHVSLKIYDVLGNEIISLINEFRDAGIQSVQFESNSLPNGIYFYKINAGSYSQTKKMILLK